VTGGSQGAGYRPVIGLEVHAQLLTHSKMFCGCDARYSGARPNSHVCPVCLGLPGALPVINRAALEQTLMVATALNCRVPETSRFDRKNYPYPDIPKGYQISQYAAPLGRAGHLDIFHADGPDRVGIIRVHLEEDTGKTMHSVLDGRPVSLVDYNRSGVPLLEIVSEPCIHSPDAARRYFAGLREVLVYLGVNSGDMEEGVLRADVNVSLSRGAHPGAKVEIKNLNSFRAVTRALEFEIDRQAALLEAGGQVAQETRGWDEGQEETVSQRSKEYAEDYRYFPEPDLPALTVSPERVEEIRRTLPELPAARRARYVDSAGLSPYEAEVITQDPALASLFDETLSLQPPGGSKAVANWIMGELLRLLHEAAVPLEASNISPRGLSGLLRLLGDGTITNAQAKIVFARMFETGAEADEIVRREGLAQIADTDELAATVRRVLAENEALVRDYVEKGGKTEGPLIGKVMAATGGRANAALVRELIRSLLSPEATAQ